MSAVSVRPETVADVGAVRQVVGAAFSKTGATEPDDVYEVRLLDALRLDGGWIPELSLVAEVDGVVVGHVVCTRAHVDQEPVLGLGPLSVAPSHQRQGVGTALMEAALDAVDRMGEALVVLLGHTDYYPRFGFVVASTLGIRSPDPAWGESFMARPMAAYDPQDPRLRGAFAYATPFSTVS